jgi:hypothetical protein
MILFAASNERWKSYMSDADPADALEMARCAQINFRNFSDRFGWLATHPFYRIALHQLALAIEKLGGEKVGQL